ncbi:hypothetical protein J2T41_004518 [Pseudomonas citronellolis]|uniref:DUF1329 domain-containing protein n=1 Tax=Pseudomonas citronellolis TaxID=53408 RepID=UPI00209EF9ED|nr:DUF1329 domain-containing protein [Pseudomonas citronellolis]MCP1644879.1 hypothetical protein [Pseudomonas citronellolis]MCP1667824.1 hypothetical protein [Pseudomonas citronellolis]MCP1699080.1 hypothetical protein [Pseudomonas citronellolis]MCP1704931.1 hypothetical protein [Pseudomonas citronellolis]MCP1799643.1 hypothetical protein [Pseudomonas citronellolis]
MLTTRTLLKSGTLAFTLLTGHALAAVPADQVATLGTSLTPMGAQKEGNADGSIPAWTGGLPTNAGKIDAKGFLSDPFAGEKPLFVITSANAQQYKDKLTAGQLAMLQRYPDSYRIPVYPTHRTAALPDAIYQAVKASAQHTELLNGGNGLKNFDSHYYPFPIPHSGVEVVWNHETRYRGGNIHRYITRVQPQTDGSFTMVHFEDEVSYPANLPDADKDKSQNVLFYFIQRVNAPARLAGNVLLVHETIDQVAEPRQAWLYNAGQRRVRRAPQVAYDGPATAADGLATADNYDMYNGSPDRYEWKLVGKKELYIPYNSYKLDSPTLKYEDILKPGHINQDLTRYELHRVWEVEATLRPGERHIYAKRHMYFDEDTWQLAEVDHYDGRGQLWRVAEGHAQQYYHKQVPGYTAEVLYDLISGRYSVMGLKNEEKQSIVFGAKALAADYTPASLRQAGVR